MPTTLNIKQIPFLPILKIRRSCFNFPEDTIIDLKYPTTKSDHTRDPE